MHIVKKLEWKHKQCGMNTRPTMRPSLSRIPTLDKRIRKIIRLHYIMYIIYCDKQ